ncbi:uncharacterized mitochondrial protein AtMg00810-like [Cryptomeria japonica]|uniref:uncharacterized mitochondrial protein AtMg00810-like n=1 Tax=Cryptomeria japonica TaxID=3369 RepID=UPI0027DA0ADE|nr:uncharacterized mitochondrial protein AtMg00810-like [Cryptomeria japonica]
MTDLGLMRYFLGIEVHQSSTRIFICQSKYANEILKRFDMLKSKPAPTPVTIGLKLRKEGEGQSVDPTLYKRMVGSLMYLTATTSDIMYGVNYFRLVGYSDSDSDCAGSVDDRKSRTGYCFHLGTGIVSWASQKQPIVTLSSTEAEYVVATSVAC